MSKIAVFYHCLFYHGNPPELRVPACEIVAEQMSQLEESGLLDAVSEMTVGINGPVEESREAARMFLPPKSRLVFHGPNSFAENLTLVELEKWAPSHPDWLVLYIHCKAATHDPNSDYFKMATRWRRCHMHHLVTNWSQCVSDLERFEAVGAHWLTNQGWDRSQHYFAGNMYWVRASFFATIPSIYTRARIKESGIASAESRYEAEVILGNGPRVPVIRDYATHAIGGCP